MADRRPDQDRRPVGPGSCGGRRSPDRRLRMHAPRCAPLRPQIPPEYAPDQPAVPAVFGARSRPVDAQISLAENTRRRVASAPAQRGSQVVSVRRASLVGASAVRSVGLTTLEPVIT
jgi:hypothetical protein